MQRYQIQQSFPDCELSRVLSLYADIDGGEGRFDLSELLHIKAHADVMLGVWDSLENVLVAFAWVKVHEQQAIIMDPVVSPEHRQFGVGQTLLRSILTTPALENCDNIELAKNANESDLFDSWRLPWMQPPASNTTRTNEPEQSSLATLRAMMFERYQLNT